jgi:hypothetical protein
MALELLPDGDERRREILLARAAAGLKAQADRTTIAADARAAAELLATEEGADVVADRVAELLGSASTDREATWLVASIARPWLAEHRRDLTWARIRQAELDEADFNDPHHPGLPLHDENRREHVEVIERLRRAGENTTGLFPQFASRASALEQIDREDRAGSFAAGWTAGDARYSIEALNNMISDSTGNPSLLANGHAWLARMFAIVGEHDEADSAIAESRAWLSRSSASGPAFQVEASRALIAGVRGRPPTPLPDALDVLSRDAQTRWAALAVVASTALGFAHQGEA